MKMAMAKRGDAGNMNRRKKKWLKLLGRRQMTLQEEYDLSFFGFIVNIYSRIFARKMRDYLKMYMSYSLNPEEK